MTFPVKGHTAQSFTEQFFERVELKVGKRYLHPEDGEIEITSGQWWGTHGLSNFWNWTVVATGEKHHGYGGNWPEVER